MLNANQNIGLATSIQPLIIPPLDGEMLRTDGISCQFKITNDISNNQLGVYQIILQPYTIGAGLHFHQNTDETFIVLKGTLTVQSFDTSYDVEEGTVIHVPRLTPHAFSNNSPSETRILLVFNPGQQREGFFRELFQAIPTNTLETPAFQELSKRYDTFSITNTNHNQNEHE